MKVKELFELLKDHMEKEVMIYNSEYMDASALGPDDVFLSKNCEFYYFDGDKEVVLR